MSILIWHRVALDLFRSGCSVNALIAVPTELPLSCFVVTGGYSRPLTYLRYGVISTFRGGLSFGITFGDVDAVGSVRMGVR